MVFALISSRIKVPVAKVIEFVTQVTVAKAPVTKLTDNCPYAKLNLVARG